MTPRRFLNFFSSPTGALTLFLLGLVIVLILVNSRRSPQQRVSLIPPKSSKPSCVETHRNCRRQFGATWFRSIRKRPRKEPEPSATPPKAQTGRRAAVPVISFVAETPAVADKRSKEIQRRLRAVWPADSVRAGHHGRFVFDSDADHRARHGRYFPSRAVDHSRRHGSARDRASGSRAGAHREQRTLDARVAERPGTECLRPRARSRTRCRNRHVGNH